MAHFKKKRTSTRRKIIPCGYDDAVFPTSYDGGKAHNRQEQRLVDQEEDQLKDVDS
jgi:hypothetical protein